MKKRYCDDSLRLQFWDYTNAALYFITVKTKNRVCYFGEVSSSKIKLSPVGQIVREECIKTFELRKEMKLWKGEFCVMPNHFHALIGIGFNPYNSAEQLHIEHFTEKTGGDAMPGVPQNQSNSLEINPELQIINPFKNKGEIPKNQFGPQSNNLFSILRGFKSAVTVRAREIEPEFAWQSRFYEHSVRNQSYIERISWYIKTNPENWKGI